MDLFTNQKQNFADNNSVRKIKNCISNKGSAFDKLRLKMIKELLKLAL